MLTWRLGFEICRRLRERDLAVRALVRPESPRTQDLAALGIEIAIGDLKDPPSVHAACRSQATVVSTATCTTRRKPGDSLKSVDRDGQLGLVEAARAEGVTRFVYVSVTPNLAERSLLTRYKREVERAVRESGMTWTVLQPGAFMETWLSPLTGWDIAQGRARIVGDGSKPASLVSLNDVAEFATLAVDQANLTNRVVAIGGPEALSPIQILQICEEASGRRFHVQRVPAPILRFVSAILRPLLPIPVALLDLAIDANDRGYVIDMTSILGELPVPLTSVRSYVVRTLGTAGPDAQQMPEPTPP
jgi:uncharacterized protein YbjT (DUF2867 family)